MIIPLELTFPQGEMLSMLPNKIPFPLFIGGYGCGKSEILVANAIRDVMEFNGCFVACYAPTLDLLDLNLVPRIEERLDELGIKHKMNKSKHILNIQGNRRIIFRSMDNPARIVAYEVYRSHVDEVDLMNTVKKGNEAWDRILGRNRQLRLKKNKPKKKNGDPNLHKKHFNMVSGYSTPEGFKFTYKRWKKEPGVGYKYITAPTSSNWNLDQTFINNLKDSYTPEQCKAYLLGIWTNIFSGTVYSYFDRETHNTNRKLIKNEPIYVGCDFNYGGSCASIYVPKKQIVDRYGRVYDKKEYNDTNSIDRRVNDINFKDVGLIMTNEFAVHDTEEMVEVLQESYHGRQITMFPDSTGKKNNSNASMSDIAMLKQADFIIKARSINPRIVDRINSVQRLLYNKNFEINIDQCPKSTEALEEHAYSETTGLPEKITGPATIDDRNDAMGYCPAFLHPIKKVTTKMIEI